MPSTPASPNDAQILRGALSRALPSTSPSHAANLDATASTSSPARGAGAAPTRAADRDGARDTHDPGALIVVHDARSGSPWSTTCFTPQDTRPTPPSGRR